MPTTTIKTLNFLTPSLHPNTLIDLSFPEPALGPSAAPSEPIVTHLPIKYGAHSAVGGVKRMIQTAEDEVMVADDRFQLSTLSLSPIGSDKPGPPEVKRQSTVKARSKDVWAGLVSVENGVISALTSGQLTFHPSTSEASTSTSTSASTSSRSVPSPLTCLASTPLAPGQIAMGGKEVDVSVWDVERTFANSADVAMGETGQVDGKGKRKKDALVPGQIWQAKNVPPNHLSLRQPIHHLSLAYLPSSPNLLVSGTKQGTVRRYDTRQRKPLSDWKVAREGGVGCLVPGVEHELFFADRSNLLGSLDLRTGKTLYTYPTLTSTPHTLLAVPPSPSASSSPEPLSLRLGLASLALDATFRLHSTTTPPSADHKGNWGGEGTKGGIVGMSGGVGLGQGVWRGWGEKEVVVERRERSGRRGDGDEHEDGDEDEEDEEEMWEGMDEIEDPALGSDESDAEEQEEPKRKPASKRAKKS